MLQIRDRATVEFPGGNKSVIVTVTDGAPGECDDVPQREVVVREPRGGRRGGGGQRQQRIPRGAA